MKDNRIFDAEFKEIVESENKVRVERIRKEVLLLIEPYIRNILFKGNAIRSYILHSIFEGFKHKK